MFLRSALFACLVGGAAAAQEGRYAAVSSDAGGVWIVDTETGEAKFCWPIMLPNEYIGDPPKFEMACVKVDQ